MAAPALADGTHQIAHQGGGYDGGRWLLDIVVPDGNGKGERAYPNAPPAVRFVTRICAANVGFEVSFSMLFAPSGSFPFPVSSARLGLVPFPALCLRI